MQHNFFIQFQLIFLLLVLNRFIDGAMTEAQIKSTGRLVRNMCQPKNKALDEEIDKMHTGDWNVEHNTMCYLHCVIATQKLITKDNVLDYETAINLVKKNLPVSMRDAVLVVIETCKDAVKTVEDKCVAAYELAKCVYEANPEMYFLP